MSRMLGRTSHDFHTHEVPSTPDTNIGVLETPEPAASIMSASYGCTRQSSRQANGRIILSSAASNIRDVGAIRLIFLTGHPILLWWAVRWGSENQTPYRHMSNIDWTSSSKF